MRLNILLMRKVQSFFDYEIGTKLNGIWLLNGIIDENGKFVAKQRDDICRYTLLTEAMKTAMKNQEAFGEFSSDIWGDFITGYAPVYTVEGNFVGLLGIDMDPDKYQQSAKNMLVVLFSAFVIFSITMVGLFLFFYFKYIKAKEGKLYFDFYSRMSHDMRTPMNGILGMALLSREENDVDVLHRNFEQVEEAGNYMLGLINDTLDVQKLDAGKLRLDPKIRNCRELIEGLVRMIQSDADKKHIQFELIDHGIGSDHYCYVDELRISQIFMNIASNAIKFTPEGGKVRFVVDCTGKDGKVCHYKFQISDSGIGMSKDFIDNRLFRPFEQEQDSVTTQYGGSGLGLSIVKNLVELMGGKIQVDSAPGEGTTFTIYLDIEEVDEEIAEKTIQQEKAEREPSLELLKGKRVLLCEDHRLNAEIATRLLEKYGCIVTLAENSQRAVEIFEHEAEEAFDVILMDIRMPIMDGLEAAKQIRQMTKKDASTIPIIAMTANAYEEDINHCMMVGMNAHIAKPIQPELMYQTIIRVLK